MSVRRCAENFQFHFTFQSRPISVQNGKGRGSQGVHYVLTYFTWLQSTNFSCGAFRTMIFIVVVAAWFTLNVSFSFVRIWMKTKVNFVDCLMALELLAEKQTCIPKTMMTTMTTLAEQTQCADFTWKLSKFGVNWYDCAFRNVNNTTEMACPGTIDIDGIVSIRKLNLFNKQCSIINNANTCSQSAFNLWREIYGCLHILTSTTMSTKRHRARTPNHTQTTKNGHYIRSTLAVRSQLVPAGAIEICIESTGERSFALAFRWRSSAQPHDQSRDNGERDNLNFNSIPIMTCQCIVELIFHKTTSPIIVHQLSRD